MKIMRCKSRMRKGFTLVEAVVVLVIISILAAIAAPSIFSFLESGRQTNRANIARTLYLAAQSQLTQLRVTRGLEQAVTGDPALANNENRDGDGNLVVLPDRNVYTLLEFDDADLAALGEDLENRNRVGFISKPRGPDMPDLMARLLVPITNREIFDAAILIEFNIVTGTVLSVFYGDVNQTDFVYTDDGRNGVLGERGMAYMGTAADRRQGFYGVGNTGFIDISEEMIINLYDSLDTPLPAHPNVLYPNRNTLYADISIPIAWDLDSTFVLSIIGNPSVLPLNNGRLISVGADGQHRRYIYYLDRVTGNTNNGFHSIEAFVPPALYTGDIALRITAPNGLEAFSWPRHPYYASDFGSNYSVRSERHLFNVRHRPGAVFSLDAADINLTGNGITNFRPIPNFSGTFNGNNRTIANLAVSVNGDADAGLFANVISSGTVNNLQLVNPGVSGTNAGAVAGVLSGTVSGVYVRYDAGRAETIQGTAAAGGIAGSVTTSGTITNTTFISPNPGVHITGPRTLTGGIAGSGSGTLDNVLFLALAPRFVVAADDDDDEITINPIAGSFTGTTSNAFYLSGTPVHPDDEALGIGRDGYNQEAQNGDFGVGLATLRLWELPPDSGRTRNPWISDGNYLEDYPYHFLTDQASVISAFASASWPVADDISAEARLVYYELYDLAGNMGYARYNAETDEWEPDAELPLAANGSNRIVTHDGYAIEITGYDDDDKKDGKYILTIGGKPFDISGWEVFGIDDDEKSVAWILIPNDVWDDDDVVWNDDDFTVAIGLDIGSVTLLEEEFNPLFAPWRFDIRSPRHMSNIGKVDSDDLTYNQRLNLNFGRYYINAAVSGNNLILPNSELEFEDFAVVRGEFRGTYNGNGLEVRDLAITGTGDDVGLFSINNGTISGVTLVNASVSGSDNVGGIAGVNNGTISGVYVRYDIPNQRIISGTGNVGGIAGSMTVGGRIENTTFISPNNFPHITGLQAASTGGIAGNGSGTLNNVLFLALAPRFVVPAVDDEDEVVTINPIAGSFTGTSNAFYLSGTPVRPVGTALAERSGYNQEVQNDDNFGTGRATLELWDPAPVSGWTRNPDISEDNYEDIYPYHFLNGQSTAAYPHWPVAEGEKADAWLEYVERYGADDWGYFVSNSNSSLRDGIVTYDGYALNLRLPQGPVMTYQLFINGDKYDIVCSATGITGKPEDWPHEPSYLDADDVRRARIFIPNSLLEVIGANVQISLSRGDTGTDIIPVGTTFNPLFAKMTPNIIRSPRHIDNIRLNPGGSYLQEIDINYAVYFRGLNNYLNTTDDSLQILNAAAVRAAFTGTYNGGGRQIRNLRINATGDNVGLFTAIGSGGTVQNTRLIGASITGNNYVGGIAGRNAGTITRSFVGFSGGFNSVTGSSYVGGLAGETSGSISICYVDFTRVGRDDGTSTFVGGVAGLISGGTVSDVFYNYGDLNPQTGNFVLPVPIEGNPARTRNPVHGAVASTGGLAGQITAGSLSNSYTNAFFVSGIGNTNTVVGTGSPVHAPADVYYLRVAGSPYNAQSTSGGTERAVGRTTTTGLRTALTTGNWAAGSAVQTAYRYPTLNGLPVPLNWPEPGAVTFNFAYYEMYQEGFLNPATGGNYGLWFNENADRLSYDPAARVMEDGYIIILSTGNSGGSVTYHNLGATGGPIRRHDVTNTNLPILGGGTFTVLNVLEFAGRANGLEPMHVQIIQGNNNGPPEPNPAFFNGFYNPNFAKAIWTFDEINALGGLANQRAYFAGYEYSVRTPRQLNNITRDVNTRGGRYLQEIDIDFQGLNTASGYWIRNQINNTAATAANRPPININNSVVPGTFTGTYRANSPYRVDGSVGTPTVRTIKNIGATTSDVGRITTGGGIFQQISAAGTVQDLHLENNIVNGAGSVGGLTGTNAGTVRNIEVRGGSVTGTGDNVGGVIGQNTGTTELSDLRVLGTVINGNNNVGGIAGSTAARIIRGGVDKLTVTAGNTVTDRFAAITGTGSNVGGIAGISGAEITRCRVVEATVTGANNVGGVAGQLQSSGSVRDVFFLNTADPRNVPVRHTGTNGANGGITGANIAGGIVGQNGSVVERAVERAFYIAPAPGRNQPNRTIYPIVGGGNPAATGTFTIDEDDDPIPYTTSFYLHGLVYSLDKGDTWSDPVAGINPAPLYNMDMSGGPRPAGETFVRFGGVGLYSDTLNLPIITDIFGLELANWEHRGAYPYPSLRELRDNPADWPLTDRGQALQVDRDPEQGHSVAENVFVVPFENGDFSWPLFNPVAPPDRQGPYPILVSGTSAAYPGGLMWNTGNPVPDPNRPFHNHINGDRNTSWFYTHMDWVPGWLTRPANPNDNSNTTGFGNPFWANIEYQRPSNPSGGGRPRTDIRGGMDGWFAELNAEIPGTLYQVQDTRPGSEFYYSFFHTPRNTANPTGSYSERMNFLLSSMNDHGNNVYTYANGTGPTKARPVETDRGPVGGTPLTRNTVSYGNVQFYDPATGGQRTAFLYDVWIGGLTGPGHGITFWSNQERVTKPLRVNRTNVNDGIIIDMAGAGANVTANSYTITVTGRSVAGTVTGSPSVGIYNSAATPGILNQSAILNNTGGSFTVSHTATRAVFGATPRIRVTAGANNSMIIDNIIITNNTTGQVVYNMQARETAADLRALTTSSARLRRSAANVTVSVDEWSRIPQVAASIDALNDLFGHNVESNIIGYWDVPWFAQHGRISEWKQFYGFYRVPAGQTKTEFAFQSDKAFGHLREGNFLDGIAFQSTAFMTINKEVFHANGGEANFAAPSERLTVRLTAENHGEIRAGGIVITDRLAPFTEYLDFVPGSVRVDGLTTGFAHNYNAATGTLTVEPNVTLARNERVTVEIEIEIRQYVRGMPGVLNMGHFIRNQALIRHTDAGFGKVDVANPVNGIRGWDDYPGVFTGYSGTRAKSNASNDIRIDVDPVWLSKTVGKSEVSSGEEFEVTLKLERQGDANFNASGTIHVTLAEGFEWAGDQPDWNVRLNASNPVRELTYTIRYTGNGYGVTRDAASARYTYTFFDRETFVIDIVTLGFPQTFVGIRANPAANEIVPLTVGNLIPSMEVTHPGLIRPFALLNNYLLNNVLRDGPYVLETNIILIDGDGNQIPQGTHFSYGSQTAGPGNFGYRAGISLAGDNRMLDFTPTPQGGDRVTGFNYSARNYTLRYIVEVIAHHQGGGDNLKLTSEERTITVVVGTGNSQALGGSGIVEDPDVCDVCHRFDYECECDCDDCGVKKRNCVCVFCDGCDKLLADCDCVFCADCGFLEDNCECCEDCKLYPCAPCICETCEELANCDCFDACVCLSGDCTCVCICEPPCGVCDVCLEGCYDCCECGCDDCGGINALAAGLDDILLVTLPVYLLGRREWIRRRKKGGKYRAGR